MDILSLLLLVGGILLILAAVGIIMASFVVYRPPVKQPYRCKWKHGQKVR